MVASCKLISVDSKKMSPILCKTLPKELLLLIIARLPVRDIARLRLLSKEWNRDMATANSEINRVCDEASPTRFVYFSFGEGYSDSDFIVTICDLSTRRSQYSYRMHPGNSLSIQWDDMCARDGGLVCFVSTWRPNKAQPLCILVVNLLTRVSRRLPPLQYVYFTPPKMVHIEVDSETKRYRVVVVGKNMKSGPSVEMYDSGARQWTKATPPRGFIFGLSYTWRLDNYDETFKSRNITRVVYDFAGRQLKHYDARGPHRGASVMNYVHHHDCMFVLHKGTSKGGIIQARGYCITKYRLQTNAEDWVQERSYLCSPFEDFREVDCQLMSVKACEGFLMVFSYLIDNFWLLDLSSGEWSSHPNRFDDDLYGSLISRAFWNAVP